MTRNTPKVKLGVAFGIDVCMSPPEQHCICPAWSVSVSSDDADHTVELKSEDTEIILFDGSKVKLHAFACVGLASQVGRAVHLVRLPSTSDGRSFVKEYEKAQV